MVFFSPHSFCPQKKVLEGGAAGGRKEWWAVVGYSTSRLPLFVVCCCVQNHFAEPSILINLINGVYVFVILSPSKEHYYDGESGTGYLAWRIKTIQRSTARDRRLSFGGDTVIIPEDDLLRLYTVYFFFH